MVEELNQSLPIVLLAACLAVIGVGLLVFSARRIPAGPVKAAFLISVANSLLWVFMVLLNRMGFLAEAQRLFLARATLALSVVLINTFSVFALTFIGRMRTIARRPWAWVLVLASLLAIGACFSNQALRKVTNDRNFLIVDFGPLYAYVLAVILVQGVVVLCVLVHYYRHSNDDVLKSQLQSVFFVIFVAIALCLLSYTVIPLLYGGVRYVPIGPVSFIALFFWLAYVLSQGHLLLIRKRLWSLIRIPELQVTNAVSFANVTSAVRNGLKGQVENNARFSFGSQSTETAFELRLYPKPRPHLPYLSFDEFDPRRLLEPRLLPLSPLGFLKKKEILPQGLESYEPEKYRAVIENNIDYMARIFGADLIAFSKDTVTMLSKLTHSAGFTQHPLTLIGGHGSGRATLARALHFYRQASNLTEFSCYASSTPEQIRQEVDKFLHLRDSGRPGLLVKNIQRLSTEDLSLLEPLLQNHGGNKYVYLTSTPELANKIEATAYDTINQLMEFQISVVPLHYCKEDIFYQIIWLCLQQSPRLGRRIDKISGATMAAAMKNPWPGNYVQLKHLFSRAIWGCTDHYLHSVPNLRQTEAELPATNPLEQSERNVIMRTFQQNDHNKSRTARELGITVNTLKSKIRKYKLLS